MKTIGTNELKLISNYMDKHNPKYELNGIFLDREEDRIVATDTKALIAFRVELECGGIIDKDVVNLVLKTTTKNKPLGLKFMDIDSKTAGMMAARDSICISTGDISICTNKVAGRYPEWKRIADSYSKEDIVVENISSDEILIELHKQDININDKKYLEPVIEYLKTCENKNCTIITKGTDRPITIVHGNFTLIIMPIVS